MKNSVSNALDLLSRYHECVLAGKTNEADKLKTELESVLSGMADKTEKSFIEKLKEEADRLAEFNNRINPINKNTEDISTLKNDVDHLKVITQFLTEPSGAGEKHGTNRDVLVRSLPFFRNAWAVLVGVAVVIVGIFFGTLEISDYFNTNIDEHYQQNREELQSLSADLKSELRNSVNQSLLASNIVSTSQEVIIQRFEERFWNGHFSRSIRDIDQTIRNLNVKSTEHFAIPSRRIPELAMMVGEYRNILLQLSLLDRNSLQIKYGRLGCTTEKLLQSFSMLSSALRHVSEGELSIGLDIIKAAFFDQCMLEELVYFDVILRGMAEVNDGTALVNSAALSCPKKALNSSRLLYAYAKFSNDFVNKGIITIEIAQEFKASVAQVMPKSDQNLRWSKLTDYYQLFAKFIVEKQKINELKMNSYHNKKPDSMVRIPLDVHQDMLRNSTELLRGWPEFIKATNQSLNAIYYLGGLDQIDRGIAVSYYDVYRMFNDLFEVYFHQDYINYLDTLAKTGMMLLRNVQDTNHFFVLGSHEEMLLKDRTKMILGRMCTDQRLASSFQDLQDDQIDVAKLINDSKIYVFDSNGKIAFLDGCADRWRQEFIELKKKLRSSQAS